MALVGHPLISTPEEELTANPAPYYLRPGRNAAEPAAPTRDTEIDLPPLDTRYESQFLTTSASIPSEEDAGHLFEIFFSDVHPYVPVVNRNHFYQQWQSNRSWLSPLLLEAMLACAGRLSAEPAQGARWLALANSKYFYIFQLGELTGFRSRGFISGYSPSEHNPSSPPPAQGSGGRAEEGLLLSVVDDVQDNRFHGQRSGTP